QANPTPMQLVATGETTGWFDPARDGGFIRRAQASYLADAGDAYVSPFLVRQYALRKSDLVAGTTGRDPRGRTALIEVTSINDQPPEGDGEVTEMVLERARRLVEQGRDVVIVLDSLTRMARAHNTAERGTGRTMSGGLDSQAMAKPKAFFGSARAVASTSGG